MILRPLLTVSTYPLIWMPLSGNMKVKENTQLFSMYAITNFGGFTLIVIHIVWNIHIPPRVHIFLWLLYQNND
jgi:hypothetical protein